MLVLGLCIGGHSCCFFSFPGGLSEIWEFMVFRFLGNMKAEVKKMLMNEQGLFVFTKIAEPR